MKYSFMSFSCPEAGFEDALKLAVKLGYAGFEPRLGSGHKHGVEADTARPALAAMKRTAAGMGIAVCCLASGAVFADRTKAEESIAIVQRTADTASALGCPRIRVFGGKIPQGVSREDAVKYAADSLTRLSDAIKGNNVTVCMETHDDWCNPDHVVEVMKLVNRPNIAVNWDIMHPVLTAGWTIDAAYEVLKPWIRHIHIHDGSRDNGVLTFLPIGTGKVDHRAALRLVKKDNYADFISGEWINWNHPDYLKSELASLLSLETEV